MLSVPEKEGPDNSVKTTSAVNALEPPNSETIIELAADEKVTINIKIIITKPMVPEINLPVITKLKLPEPKLYNSLLLYFSKLESFSDSSLLALINVLVSCLYLAFSSIYEQPVVEPQLTHFKQLPFETSVNWPHSGHGSPSNPNFSASLTMVLSPDRRGAFVVDKSVTVD